MSKSIQLSLLPPFLCKVSTFKTSDLGKFCFSPQHWINCMECQPHCTESLIHELKPVHYESAVFKFSVCSVTPSPPRQFLGQFGAGAESWTRSSCFNSQGTDSWLGKQVPEWKQCFAGLEPRTTSWDGSGIIVTNKAECSLLALFHCMVLVPLDPTQLAFFAFRPSGVVNRTCTYIYV